MFSEQSASVLRKEFWTSFGQYLAPIPSADGNKINWINYKTGIRFINFKMDVAKDHAYIAIEISHPDIVKQEIYFDYFKRLWLEMRSDSDGEWIWEKEVVINGKNISRIYQTLQQVNLYKQADWPQIISFLKARVMLLDDFWINHNEIFEMLA